MLIIVLIILSKTSDCCDFEKYVTLCIYLCMQYNELHDFDILVCYEFNYCIQLLVIITNFNRSLSCARQLFLS